MRLQEYLKAGTSWGFELLVLCCSVWMQIKSFAHE